MSPNFWLKLKVTIEFLHLNIYHQQRENVRFIQCKNFHRFSLWFVPSVQLTVRVGRQTSYHPPPPPPHPPICQIAVNRRSVCILPHVLWLSHHSTCTHFWAKPSFVSSHHLPKFSVKKSPIILLIWKGKCSGDAADFFLFNCFYG